MAWLSFETSIGQDWNLPSIAYLCSQHFQENCFDRTVAKIKLRKNSILTHENDV